MRCREQHALVILCEVLFFRTRAFPGLLLLEKLSDLLGLLVAVRADWSRCAMSTIIIVKLFQFEQQVTSAMIHGTLILHNVLRAVTLLRTCTAHA